MLVFLSSIRSISPNRRLIFHFKFVFHPKYADIDDDYDDDYDDDVSLYGNMDTDDDTDWKIPAGNVVLGDKLPNAKGRFADIHSATLKSKGGRQNIVAKTLKSKLCSLNFALLLIYS